MTGPNGVTVCLRAKGETSPIGGTDTDTCDRCGSEVWVSEGTRLSIERGEYPETIWCTPCVAEVEDDD